MESSEPSGEVAIQSAPVAAVRRVPISEHININAFWLANNFQWQALFAIVLPSMIVKFLGNPNKDINLAMVIVWGTALAVIVNPLTGAISDYATFRLGRRRPFMLVGTVLNVLVLILFAFAPSWFSSTELLVTFLCLFLLLETTNNLANAPWSAIIADKIPQNQRGITAGFNGLFILMGTALGSIVAGVIVNKHDSLPLYRNEIVQIFLLIAAVQLAFVVYTVLTVKETPLPAGTRFQLRVVLQRFLFNPLRYPDLAWVLLGRLLMMMGIWGVFYFLQYYFDDVLGGTGVKTLFFGTPFSGEQFNGTLFQPALIILALPTSLIAGWMSDRYGRKSLVYLAGAVMSIVCLLFVFFQTQGAALIAGACFGIGFGAYSSVDWALVCDVLPPTGEAGKFLGLWSAMGIIPQVVGITVGALILQTLQNLPNHLGYTVLFLVTIVYFVGGTLVIRRVRAV